MARLFTATRRSKIVLFGLNLPLPRHTWLDHPPTLSLIKTACRPSNLRLYKMTNSDLTLHRETLLALRARLQGDMTQMEDNALNKDHSRTTSMPSNMAELGSDNSTRNSR